MADRQFTLLEPHFHSHGDITISPGIETGGTESAFGELLGSGSETSSTQRDETSEESGRRLPIVAFAFVLVAAVAAAALRRRQSATEATEDKRRIPPT